MKRLSIFFWATLVGSLSSLIKAEPILLNFGTLNFEYPRDGFQSKIFEASVSPQLEGSQLSITAESDPVACGLGSQQCYPVGQEGIGLALEIEGNSVSATSAQAQTMMLSSTHPEIKAKLVVYNKLASASYPLNALALPVFKVGQKSLPIQFSPTTVTILQKTCELQQKDLQVRLKSVSVSTLNAQSEIAGQSFELGLKCNSDAVRADVVFTDQTTPTNREDYLTLTADSTAKGVGIAIVKQDGTKVKFGEKWMFSENENEPRRQFSANYVKTGSTISPGSLTAIATIAFTYH